MDDFGENGSLFDDVDEDALEAGRRAAYSVSRNSSVAPVGGDSTLKSDRAPDDFMMDNNFDQDFGDANDLDHDLFGTNNFPANQKAADDNAISPFLK